MLYLSLIEYLFLIYNEFKKNGLFTNKGKKRHEFGLNNKFANGAHIRFETFLGFGIFIMTAEVNCERNVTAVTTNRRPRRVFSLC